MSSFTPLFTKHSRSWRDNRYVYPVISRRSGGLSVGVNLNPDKVCNFDCVYCCVDRSTLPGKVTVSLDVLRTELEHMLEMVARGELWRQPPFDQTPEVLRRLNDVAFSGDGEPTSFGKFEEVCRLSSDTLKRLKLDAKLVVITNATLFHQPRVKKALAYLDTVPSELWSKLDAGTQDYYQRVERTSVPLSRVMRNLLDAGRERPIVIQSLFMNLQGEPVPEPEIAAYLDRLRDLQTGGCQIKLVQVYTVARGPAEQYVSPLDRPQIDAIVARVSELGLKVAGYYGPE